MHISLVFTPKTEHCRYFIPSNYLTTQFTLHMVSNAHPTTFQCICYGQISTLWLVCKTVQPDYKLVGQILNQSGTHKGKKRVNKPASTIKKQARACNAWLSTLCVWSAVTWELWQTSQHLSVVDPGKVRLVCSNPPSGLWDHTPYSQLKRHRPPIHMAVVHACTGHDV